MHRPHPGVVFYLQDFLSLVRPFTRRWRRDTDKTWYTDKRRRETRFRMDGTSESLQSDQRLSPWIFGDSLTLTSLDLR